MDEKYWTERYENANTPWDLGGISEPLKTYFDQLTDHSISILIPGCGRGYEAIYLQKKGFENVTVIDLVESSVEQLREHEGINVIVGDFFNLKESFDLIVEQTLFCALPTEMRQAYITKVKQLLRPNGKFVGLLFNRTFEHTGPPFGGSKTEYIQLFTPLFSSLIMEPCYNSIIPRKDTELFFIAKL